MANPLGVNGRSDRKQRGITQIAVAGYKSIAKGISIDVSPLTILAGANSSGKSSIMQPLLLLKQTMEAGYDPGPLLLNGPNIRFTSADQLLSRVGPQRDTSFSVGVRVDERLITVHFSRHPGKGLDLQRMTIDAKGESIELCPDTQPEDLRSLIPRSLLELEKAVMSRAKGKSPWVVVRNRCFLEVQLTTGDSPHSLGMGFSPGDRVMDAIRKVIHLPGLRGNPERTYPVTAVGATYPGTFEQYAAGVIAKWQANKDSERLDALGIDLERLGLTWKVQAKGVDDTQVELRLGRLRRPARGGARDFVNIADVGFGASQALPVLVALEAAQAGQLVYLEQPEIHLHPRAQTALAEVLADAANRGVRVVAETHSDLLVLAVQALVAEGRFSPEKVKLHWFSRNPDGVTEVTSADVDKAGAYGEWPEDFAPTRLEAEARYLNAAEQHEGEC
jgi:hypothetical protein